MHNKARILSTAQNASHLKGRIEANQGQQTDLNHWVFSLLSVQEGWKVLELCCGTGAQTTYLAEKVGPKGHIWALDISAEALEHVDKTLGQQYRKRITTMEVNIDDFSDQLASRGFVEHCFDLIFCSYGLYYCSNIQEALAEIERWLQPKGKVAIIGPFGPNNEPLYDILHKNGVVISDYVMHTSKTFMTLDVIPWVSEKFEHVSIHSLANPVVWESADIFMKYWKNSTFYDDTKLDSVRLNVEKHFQQAGGFVNEKWVMLLVAENKRHITREGMIVV